MINLSYYRVFTVRQHGHHHWFRQKLQKNYKISFILNIEQQNFGIYENSNLI